MLLAKIDYEFDTDPIKFNEDGHMVDVTKLVLHAPCMVDLSIVSKLKQLINCADSQHAKMLGADVIKVVTEMKEEEKEQAIKEEKEAQGIEEKSNMPSGKLSGLYSSEIDIQKVFSLFDDLVLNTGKITVNNTKTNFNKAMLSQLKLAQYEAIVDLYLSAFM